MASTVQSATEPNFALRSAETAECGGFCRVSSKSERFSPEGAFSWADWGRINAFVNILSGHPVQPGSGFLANTYRSVLESNFVSIDANLPCCRWISLQGWRKSVCDSVQNAALERDSRTLCGRTLPMLVRHHWYRLKSLGGTPEW